MKMFRLFTLAMILASLALLVKPAHAQSNDDRSLYWNRWDVTISQIDTAHNVFHVQEVHELYIVTGPFHGGDRGIPLDRITAVKNVTVTDGGQTLQVYDNTSPDNCPDTTGIVCLSQGGGQYEIYYNFFQTADDGDTRTITISYDVSGALRSYADGDWLDWIAFADSRPFDIESSTVTIHLPGDFKVNKVEMVPAWTQTSSANPLVFTLPGSLGTRGNFEVSVQYSHNPAMVAPPWQTSYDRAIRILPFVNLLALAAAGLIAIGGTLLILMRYLSHKRNIPAIVVPEYLTEPPGDQPPAVASVLMQEREKITDVMATLFDLARRGFIVIEQAKQDGFLGIGGGLDFSFHRTDAPLTGLRAYELKLVNDLFPGGVTTRHLSELRNRFYTTVDAMKSMLEQEVVRVGYFKQSPGSVRLGWQIFGGALLVAGIGGAIFIAAQDVPPLGMFTPASLPPLIALGIVGLVGLIASNFMPFHTPEGEIESAKWQAFRNYLRNIQKYANIKESSDQFEKYIGYAIAFGLDKQWIHEFSSVLTSMPQWYYPTYMYGPWSGRYPSHAGGSSMSGMSLGNGGKSGGLNQMSNDMSQGLNAMSSGLTGLLNSAASTMTSRPSSSSGGGSHGGGGSGGGHAGFH